MNTATQKNNNSFGVHFVIRMNRGTNGLYPIIGRVVVNGARFEISLKTRVSKEDWSDTKGLAKPKTEKLKKLNTYLEQIRGKVIDCYRELSLTRKKITAAAVKDLFTQAETEEFSEGDEPVRTLRWLVREHNTLMASTLARGSLKNYYTTERYLEKFLLEKLKIEDIPLKDIRLNFLIQFEAFVRTVPLKYTDPCNNNGTMKHLERVKKLMNWAYMNEWITKNPFISFKLKFRNVQREMLSEEELKVLEIMELDTKMLAMVRDLFVFSCYTGLAYTDLMNLKPEHLVENADGFTWIKTVRAKTGVQVDVPLLDTAYAMLEKYRHQKAVPRATVFPRISNQEINRSLKIIAELGRIKKNMSFHLARHTFATTITLINGVPIESISKMLGHTKLTTTMVYAKVVKKKLSMDMSLLKDKLNKQVEKSTMQMRIV